VPNDHSSLDRFVRAALEKGQNRLAIASSPEVHKPDLLAATLPKG
jgi:hypothetical protein